MVRRVRTIGTLLLRPVAFMWCALEYTILVIPLLFRVNRSLFVFPWWFWSFGHQATDLHMIAMRFPKKDISVVLSDYSNFNHYIVDSFKPYINIHIVSHSRLMKWGWSILGHRRLLRLKQRIMLFLLQCVGSTSKILPTYHEYDRSFAEGLYLTEFMELLRSTTVKTVSPPTKVIERVRQALHDHPALQNRWCVSLYLRKKKKSETDVRDTNPSYYRQLVRRVIDRGGFVFCGADFSGRDVLGESHPCVLDYTSFPACTREMLDVYFLSQASFMVGAHSGPLPVCTAYGVPVLVTNNAFFYLSAYRSIDRVMNKGLIRAGTRESVPISECCREPIVSYRMKEQFERNGLLHTDNTAEELIEGLEEMIALYIEQRNIATPEDDALDARYKSLLPKTSVAAQSPARMSIGYLRHLNW